MNKIEYVLRKRGRAAGLGVVHALEPKPISTRSKTVSKIADSGVENNVDLSHS